MGAGHPTRWSSNADGSLVPDQLNYKRPLLPYEKELIDILGCTVEEYQNFVDETVKRAQTRPAEYSHIPDIQDAPVVVPILVSLAVGVVTTAVSYLLTPKPRMPSMPKMAGQATPREQSGTGGEISLASRSGSTRYAPTSGFDSSSDLAQYGSSVPIVWTRYTGSTGGVLVSPKLVWSRLLSLGSQQSIKALYVVGEAGVSAPELPGIYLGNNGLDGPTPYNYAFWWNSNTRPTRTNLLYGTQKAPQAGDPQLSDFLFNTPLGNDGFSSCFTPSTNTQFGVSSGIPNGTQYRVNYKIISIPKATEEKNYLRRELLKVAGPTYASDGTVQYRMGGTGFGYFRRQGIIGHSVKGEITVGVGTVINFALYNNQQRDNYWGGSVGGDLTDVNSALDSECEAADSILQLGEEIMINGSVWRVINRQYPAWDLSVNQVITLICIDVPFSNKVGVLPEAVIGTDAGNIDRLMPADKHAGSVYFNLVRSVSATVRNTRPCRVTEIGIRSQVWGRFNGLCNFNSLLDGAQVLDLNKQNVTVESGYMQEYFTRTSAFTILFRPVGSYTWTQCGRIFCVRGATPVDQFHTISITHNGEVAMEYKIHPITATYLVTLPENTVLYWLKKTGTGTAFNVGGLEFRAEGTGITRKDAGFLPQMIAKPAEEGGGGGGGGGFTTAPASLDFLGGIDGYSGEIQLWAHHVYGEADTKSVGQNVATNFTFSKPSPDLRSITLRIESTVKYDNVSNSNYYDPALRATIIDYSQGGDRPWSIDNIVEYSFVTTRVWRFTNKIFPKGQGGTLHWRISGVTFNATTASTTSNLALGPNDRVFEQNTGIAEISHYGGLITRSCDSGPEHSVVFVNEMLDYGENPPSFSDLTMAAISLRSGRNVTALNQPHFWIKSGINNSNSFPHLVRYLLERVSGVANSLIDYPSIETAHNFTQSRGLFFDGAIVDKTNLRSYIASMAAYFMLNFVIANGKFSLMPAIPSGPSVPITQIFTAGNIIDDSFTVEYLSADERRDFQAVVLYRTSKVNELPVVHTHKARFNDVPSSAPIETFDVTEFCTSRNHAAQIARFFLSIRRRVTHAVRFKTAPEGNGVAPGNYIRIAIEQNAQSSFNNGVIDATGKVVSPQPLADGSYEISYWTQGMEEPATATLDMAANKTTQTELFGSIFSLYSSNITTATYLIEQVELDENGLVDVVATEYPAELIYADMQGNNMTVTDT